MTKTYESYKDSGIAWIGDIPCEWNIKRLGNFYNQRNEKVSDKDFAPLSVTMKGIVPQLETAAKTDDGDNRKLVKKGDFAINSRSDRRGSCGISEYDGSVSLINTVLCPKGKMDAGYYNWLFHTTMFADEYYKWGHGIVDDLWTTRWSEMKSICVVEPSLEEQHSIAAFLNTKCTEIDSLISLQEEMISELQAYKQSVISETVTKGLDPNVNMKESGIDWIGKIPENWQTTKIKRVSNTTSGSTPRIISNSKENGIKWFRTTDINENIVSDSPIHLTEEEFASASCPLLSPNTCLVAMYGGAGTIGKFGMLSEEATINQALCAIVPLDNMFCKYLFYILKGIRSYWMKYASGTRKDPNINQEIVRNMLIPVPPLSEQHEISDYLDIKIEDVNSLISIKQEKIQELKDYKKSIIYEYVTGKKRV